MKRFGEMSADELHAEIRKLEEQKRKAEFPSQAEMLEQKIWMAKSYGLSGMAFQPGTYAVVGRSEPFVLDYVNGVMAWGRMGEEKEASFPIAMLVHTS